MASGESWIFTPRASRTSALPLLEVKERFPCFATRTPRPSRHQGRRRGDVEGGEGTAPGAAGIGQLFRSLGRNRNHDPPERPDPTGHLDGKDPPGPEPHENGPDLNGRGLTRDDGRKRPSRHHRREAWPWATSSIKGLRSGTRLHLILVSVSFIKTPLLPPLGTLNREPAKGTQIMGSGPAFS